ncbi:MAG: UDP-N-acetylmuramoyl-tripeptide--D-alanyl-D-alanine ligase [Synechococcus sp.]|nr:UDP-N-acetylmuramoyl-tripeptide--D-alanyl-D-alanine ligase [Synechococcus sp.]
MVLRLEQLRALWGEPIAARRADGAIAAVATDSRADLRGCLFVPLVGERFDGHQFLAEVLGRAAAAIAQADRAPVAELTQLADHHGCPLWLVPDSLQALQDLARLWRRSLDLPVVAVTGSAGKTTTRELIRAALAPLGPVVASSGNENNDIGAPLTVLRAGPQTAALVVEMGMRGLGEIERLSRLAEPDVAVITLIGTAHIGRLGSREAIARAKTEIVTALRPDGLVVIPAGDPLLEHALAQRWRGRVRRVALADEQPGFSADLPPADLIAAWRAAAGERPDGAGTAAAEQLQFSDEATIRLPLPGRHNARNLLISVAVAEELGVARAALTDLNVAVPGGRSRRQRIAGVEVLDETYNASPEAMLAALDLLAATPAVRRYAVLGTMLELGALGLELHRAVGERAARHGASGRLDGLVIVDPGAEGMALQEGVGSAVPALVRVNTARQALEPLLAWLQPGDALLLKASRSVALEQLLPLLQRPDEGQLEGSGFF